MWFIHLLDWATHTNFVAQAGRIIIMVRMQGVVLLVDYSQDGGQQHTRVSAQNGILGTSNLSSRSTRGCASAVQVFSFIDPEPGTGRIIYSY